MEINLPNAESFVPNLKTVGIGVDGMQEACSGYEFTDGVYQGVVYTYYNIRFNVYDVENGKLTDLSHEDISPDDDRYALQVAFEYVVFKNPEEKNTDDKVFKEYLGAILVQLIQGSIDG